MDASKLVLVTGGTGFISSHVVRVFHSHGFTVRTTARAVDDTKRKLLEEIGATQVVACDLTSPNGWDEAVKGCLYVIHVASPVMFSSKDPQRELVEPAVSGTRFLLEACAKEKSIHKVVLTSSLAAVVDEAAKFDPAKTFTEEDWNTTSSLKSGAYEYSKVCSERFAWKFVEDHKNDISWTMVTINPSFTVGPMLFPVSRPQDVNASNMGVVRILNREYPAYPQLALNSVHVVDVAEAHFQAAIRPAGEHVFVCFATYVCDKINVTAKGRFIVNSCGPTLAEQGGALREAFPELANQIPAPNSTIPNLLTLAFTLFDSSLSVWSIYNRLGMPPAKISNAKAVSELGINFKDCATMTIDCARVLATMDGVLKYPETRNAILSASK